MRRADFQPFCEHRPKRVPARQVALVRFPLVPVRVTLGVMTA
jgi:hypothetical protein